MAAADATASATWRSRTGLAGVATSSDAFSSQDLERAARLLFVRSRREAAGGLAGGYRSAFRGGGIEFEESRPYVPGDDVRFIDWNALARTGVPYVKRFREERDQTVLLCVDVSRSMGFASHGQSKAQTASRVAALLTASATAAGDRVGLITFDDRVRAEIPPARGTGHSWRILRELAGAAGESAGRTALEAPLERLETGLDRRAVVVLVSDFRDDDFFGTGEAGGSRGRLVAMARRHDVVAVLVHDLREAELPRVGTLRIADPEAPGRTWLLSSRSARARQRYRVACEVRRRALERRLRGDGVDVLILPSERDPLRALGRFFEDRAASRARVQRR
ncbi:MAG: DUF58 domain-containing protein [Myxococcota bacterium]|nr:DUF58 domain-containing protein [Myxococcota bacterium]